MLKSSFCGLVAPSEMGDSRLREVESLLASCSGVLQSRLRDSGMKSSRKFFVELMRIHRPGSGCVVGGAVVSAADAALMMGFKEVEFELLGQFSMMIDRAVGRHAAIHGRDRESLHADAYEAFSAAMLNYDGSTVFSTFLQHCLSRNLTRACLDDSTVRVPLRVRRLSMTVAGRMRGGSTFDEAVQGLSEREVRRVLASMRGVKTTTALGIEDSELAAVEDGDSVEWVGLALEGISFTRLERAALEGFMGSPWGTMGLSSALKGLINPRTGSEYSRAAVSAAWGQARKKIGRALGAQTS